MALNFEQFSVFSNKCWLGCKESNETSKTGPLFYWKKKYLWYDSLKDIAWQLKCHCRQSIIKGNELYIYPILDLISALFILLIWKIFTWVLSSQNFADAKFCENRTLVKWQNRSVIYWCSKSCPNCKFF